MAYLQDIEFDDSITIFVKSIESPCRDTINLTSLIPLEILN